MRRSDIDMDDLAEVDQYHDFIYGCDDDHDASCLCVTCREADETDQVSRDFAEERA